MDCDQFLEGYTDYRDDWLDPGERERFDAHLEECESCARYDRVVQRGLEIFRDLPEVTPSSDFLPRLRHRIYHIEDGIPLRSAHPGGSAALVAVAAVGLMALAWLPFATRVPVEVELPAVAVDPPPVATSEPVPSLFEDGPFLRGAAGGDGRVELERSDPFSSARDEEEAGSDFYRDALRGTGSGGSPGALTR